MQSIFLCLHHKARSEQWLLLCVVGGQLSHHSDVTFQPGGERLSITQHFTGLDPHGHLAVNVHLDGTLPDVPDQATMLFEPYLETYHYHDNGKNSMVTISIFNFVAKAMPSIMLLTSLHLSVSITMSCFYKA